MPGYSIQFDPMADIHFGCTVIFGSHEGKSRICMYEKSL